MTYRLIFFLLLTASVGILILYRYRKDLNLSLVSAIILAMLHTVAGVFCVKLFSGLEKGTLSLNNGMSLFGAIFFMPIFYWIGNSFFRRDIAYVFDNLSMCGMTALMCVRINCIITGCCRGARISQDTLFRWPTREVEILFWASLLVYSVYKKEKGYKKGTMYPLMMVLYGVFRFIIEFFRDNETVVGPFHFGHIWALISLAIGSISFYMIWLKPTKILANLTIKNERSLRKRYKSRYEKKKLSNNSHRRKRKRR